MSTILDVCSGSVSDAGSSQKEWLVSVRIFAKVPYLQHNYDTVCLDEESYVLERVAGYGD